MSIVRFERSKILKSDNIWQVAAQVVTSYGCAAIVTPEMVGFERNFNSAQDLLYKIDQVDEESILRRLAIDFLDE